MASTKEYLEYVLDCLSGLDDISYRAMMGEYLIYYRGVYVAGVFDNRFLCKVTKGSVKLMTDTTYELPYDGAKEMLMVDCLEEKEKLSLLIDTLYQELPKKK